MNGCVLRVCFRMVVRFGESKNSKVSRNVSDCLAANFKFIGNDMLCLRKFLRIHRKRKPTILFWCDFLRTSREKRKFCPMVFVMKIIRTYLSNECLDEFGQGRNVINYYFEHELFWGSDNFLAEDCLTVSK